MGRCAGSMEKDPFIKLNQKYLSAYRINWQNKADNIKELAQELNIGLDSFVFVDDNPTERELVKQLLPMVEVPIFRSILICCRYSFSTWLNVISESMPSRKRIRKRRNNIKRTLAGHRKKRNLQISVLTWQA